jgi:hypothetical protein
LIFEFILKTEGNDMNLRRQSQSARSCNTLPLHRCFRFLFCSAGIQANAGLLLLALAGTAQAWTVEDCRRDLAVASMDEVIISHCISTARVLEQLNLPNGAQPSEAQRLARVREILARQKVIKFSFPSNPSRQQRQQCEQRLTDFVAGKDFEVIEPVFVLESRWQFNWEPGRPSNQGGDPRVPAVWSQCVNPDTGDSQERWQRSFSAVKLNAASVVPPYRLYELNKQQRPSAQWEYLIDFSLRGFDAVSLDKCEYVNGLTVDRRTGIPNVPPPAQAYALTRYRKELIAASIVDGARLQFSSNLGYGNCAWQLYEDK